MIGAIRRDKLNVDTFKHELGMYAQRFYDLRDLGVEREDAYSYWYHPRMSFPPGSASYRRYWLLSSLIAFWASSRENLGSLTEEDLGQVFSDLFKCAKLIEVGLTSISFNDLHDVPRNLEDYPELRRNLVNRVLREHPHPPEPS
jgi:hypothetical protein